MGLLCGSQPVHMLSGTCSHGDRLRVIFTRTLVCSLDPGFWGPAAVCGCVKIQSGIRAGQVAKTRFPQRTSGSAEVLLLSAAHRSGLATGSLL